jgi:hypothetical protein
MPEQRPEITPPAEPHVTPPVEPHVPGTLREPEIAPSREGQTEISPPEPLRVPSTPQPEHSQPDIRM